MSKGPRLTPIPISPEQLTRASGILLFGGTFDPPHLWHTAAAAAARDAIFGPNGWILFVPAAQSPLKAAAPGAADEHRIAMLKLATRATPNAAVWTEEIDRAGNTPERRSYTFQTVHDLCGRIPDSGPLRLLIGADQAADFHRWREFRYIMELAEPVVVWRPPIDSDERLRAALRAAGAWSDEEIKQWIRRVVPFPASDISSTGIRAALADPARREPALDRDLRDRVAPEVLAYIREHGLYRAR